MFLEKFGMVELGSNEKCPQNFKAIGGRLGVIGRFEKKCQFLGGGAGVSAAGCKHGDPV